MLKCKGLEIHQKTILRNELCLARYMRRNYIVPSKDRHINKCYSVLEVPVGAKQEVVRDAFLRLAKTYHPDSGSPEADEGRFCEIRDAYRDISVRNQELSESEALKVCEFDIKHVAPQHRQYLSWDGEGYGPPAQRQRQAQAARARRAVIAVSEHRIARTLTDDCALVGQPTHGKKHDIKTKYGLDRLVEDLIQESMSRGEFSNLKGSGRPLVAHHTNPYTDFTTHKMNQVLIDNGFTPQWIMLHKEIRDKISKLKHELGEERASLGPYPFCQNDDQRWSIITEKYALKVNEINAKITTYNLIVPLLTKQMLLLRYNELVKDVAENGEFSRQSDHSTVCKVDQIGEDVMILLAKDLRFLLELIRKYSMRLFKS